VYVY